MRSSFFHSYYPDLSEYVNIHNRSNQPLSNVFNIGWISNNHTFTKGPVESDFINKLKLLHDKNGTLLYRSIRICTYCYELENNNPNIDETNIEMDLDLFGFTSMAKEIWVPDLTSGIIYASPALIVHYVIHHQYQPPECYVNAVLQYDVNSDWDAYTVSDKLCFPK